MPSDSSHPSPLRSRLMLGLGSLVLALGAAELGLRLMEPVGPEFVLHATDATLPAGLFAEDPELGQRLVPNARASVLTENGRVEVRTNSLGTRGEELGSVGSDGYRVLAVGDSFTLGMQVEEHLTFSAQLSDRMSEAMNQKVTVINAGVPGYGTDGARVQMERLVERTEPNAVLLTVYAGNDLRDNARWGKDPRKAHTAPEDVPPPPKTTLLSRLSRLSRIAAYWRLMQITEDPEADFRVVEYRDEMLPFSDSRALQRLIRPTRSALQRFADACSRLKLPCMVAIAPPAYAVHTERMERTFEAFGLNPADARLDAPMAAIRASVPAGIPVVDLTGFLRQEADAGLYMRWDPHWSTAGHRVAAEGIVHQLQPLLLAEK